MPHGHSRLGAGGRSTPSPPSSPRFLHSRNKSSGGGGRGAKKSLVEKLVLVVVSAVFRRRGVLLFAPVLYITGMVLYMGSFGLDVGVRRNAGGPAPPGSVYRSPQVFEKLWPLMENERNSSFNALTMAWSPTLHQIWKPCGSMTISQIGSKELPESNGFLIIEANGGLNQQRLSICDAVAVAGLLNATLVIPIFHLNSVWQDSSNFSDIFDEDFFIDSLKNHVKIVRELPEDMLQRFDYNISSIVNLRVKAWSSRNHYLEKVLPRMKELGTDAYLVRVLRHAPVCLVMLTNLRSAEMSGSERNKSGNQLYMEQTVLYLERSGQFNMQRAVRIAPFSNRLANAVPSPVQGHRCLANFKALRFAEPIRVLAEGMVQRMIRRSSEGGGRYVSVHLRFEKDMVAFSCCKYDGGEEEKREMDIAREKGWRGKFRRKGRVIKPGANRMDGKCPLTPLEVGMMLRGMGFDNTTSVYVAAGKIYKEEKFMAPLKLMFPYLQTKDTLATPEELAPFKGFSSRLAALDYSVCLRSEVFVTTQGGNFPHFLIGHRRYLFGGHAKTIRPDKRKLALLFDNPKIRWENFKRQMQDMLRRSHVKGSELRKPGGSLYTFPMPDCMCKQNKMRHKQ